MIMSQTIKFDLDFLRSQKRGLVFTSWAVIIGTTKMNSLSNGRFVDLDWIGAILSPSKRKIMIETFMINRNLFKKNFPLPFDFIRLE